MRHDKQNAIRISICAAALVVCIAAAAAPSEFVYEIKGEKVYFRSIVRDSGDRIVNGVISRPAPLFVGGQRFLFMSGSDIYFHTNGSVKRGTLGSNSTVAAAPYTLPLAPGSTIVFDMLETIDLRRSAILLADDIGIPAGKQTIAITSNSRLFFEDDRTVNFPRSDIYTARYQQLNAGAMKIPVQIYSRIDLHTNGIPKKVLLSENMDIRTPCGTFRTRASNHISFHVSGDINFRDSVFIAVSNTGLRAGNNSILFLSNSVLGFHDNGMLKTGTTAAAMTMKIGAYRLPLAAGTVLQFDTDGEIDTSKTETVLDKPAQITVGKNMLTVTPGQPLRFHSDGSFRSGVLDSDAVLSVYGHRVPVASGTMIFCDELGEIKAEQRDISDTAEQEALENGGPADGIYGERTGIILAKDTTLPVGGRSLSVAQGTRLLFDLSGAINYSAEHFAFAQQAVFPVHGGSIRVKERTPVRFFSDRSLREAVAAADTIITNGPSVVMIPEQAMITFYSNRMIAQIRADRPIEVAEGLQRYRCNPAGLSFYTNGHLKEATLEEDGDITIQGMLLPLSKGAALRFDEGGIPIITERAAGRRFQMTVGGFSFNGSGNSVLVFNPDRSLNIERCSLFLAEETPLRIGSNSVLLAAGKQLHFSSNMTLRHVILAGDTDIAIGPHLITVAGNTVISLSASGAIDYSTTAWMLAKETVLTIGKNTIPFKEKTRLTFAADGTLLRGITARACTLTVGNYTIPFPGSTGILFNARGIAYDDMKFPLEHDITLRVGSSMMQFPKGTSLYFYLDGTLASGYINSITGISAGKTALYIQSNRMLYFRPDGQIDSDRTELVLASNIIIPVGGNTMPFLAQTRIYFYPDFSVKKGELAEKRTLKLWQYTLPFPAGKRLYFHTNGALNSEETEIFLQDDTPFTVGQNVLTFRKGAKLFFDTAGRIYRGRLSRPERVKVGGNEVMASDADDVAFFTNGSLMRTRLPSTTTLTAGENTLPLKGESTVSFHENGALAQGEAAKACELKCGGYSFRATQFTAVYFYPNGVLKQCLLSEDAGFKTRTSAFYFPGDELITFHDNGMVAHGRNMLEAETTAGGVRIAIVKEAPVELYRNGTLKSCIVASDASLSYAGTNVTIIAGSPLTFYSNGGMRSVYTRQDTVFSIHGSAAVFDARAAVCFHENGTVREGVLSADAAFEVRDKRMVFAAGTAVSFHTNGLVSRGYLRDNSVVTAGEIPCMISAYRQLCFYDDGGFRYGYIVTNDTWLYRFPGPDGAYRIARIPLDGTVDSDVSVMIGGQTITIPRGSVIVQAGDDGLFKTVTPSRDIIRNGLGIAFSGIETTLTQLEERIGESK